MPKNVKESRLKVSIGVAIATLIICLIPIGIIALVSINHPDVWSAPYPQFTIYYLIIAMYFALVIGLITPLHKTVWLVLHVITGLGTLGFLITAYILQNALLIHLASSTFFTFIMYFSGRSNDDNIYMRFPTPIVCLIAALISVLLFMGVNLTMVAQNIISAIFNGIYLIILIVALYKFIDLKEIRYVAEKELSYSQETEEEAAEAKQAKIAKKEEKMALKASKNVRSTGVTGVANDATRWIPYYTDINVILRDLIRQYNRIIDSVNDDIRHNNRELRPDTYSYDFEIKQAANSNKDIGKCVKYMKRKLNCMKKNLEKIRKKEFTAQDKYKSFTYSLLTGKLKSKPSSEETPTLYIRSCRVYYNYEAAVIGTSKAEIVFDGEDIYLQKIK